MRAIISSIFAASDAAKNASIDAHAELVKAAAVLRDNPTDPARQARYDAAWKRCALLDAAAANLWDALQTCAHSA